MQFILISDINRQQRINFDIVEFYYPEDHDPLFQIFISYNGGPGLTTLQFEKKEQRDAILQKLDEVCKARIIYLG